ncbi:glycosyltransferase family 2 protein [Methylobrevis albus]|uniref:Glycosyltransferase n=1 Tax=Methylobrevis albus TaxID=2793297 RepID=A0A931I317_9HYPH|nr:glycosyltransferase [Methylobrevis albus]MBH0238534.1 glycosyltransferase [Methylobrevis albus]
MSAGSVGAVAAPAGARPPAAGDDLPREVVAFAEALAQETGRHAVDILLGLGVLPADPAYDRMAADLGIAALDAATVALLGEIAPAFRGAAAVEAWLASRRGERGRVLVAASPRADQLGGLADLLAALPELAADLRLIAPARAGRLLAWDVGEIPERALHRAAGASAAGGSAVHRLAADPRVGEAAVCRLIARRHGVRFARLGPGWRLDVPAAIAPAVAARLRIIAATAPDGSPVIVVAPAVGRLGTALAELARHGVPRARLVVATARDLRAAVRARIARPTLEAAVARLGEIDPALSARAAPAMPLRVGLALAIPSLAAATAAWPSLVLGVALVGTTAGFIAIGLLRIYALLCIALPVRRAPPDLGALPLPRYSVLVALRDEAAMIPGLVAALERLRYPRDRLDIKIVLEVDDLATRAAAEEHCRAPHFEVLVVPHGRPATKPRALAYALAFCEGDIVAVFDAEDRPHPDQLLRAAEAFATGPADLGCVQARLEIDRIRNPLQAQFAIEYAALFEGLLPYLARLRLPMPLGGTSNHFRRAALDTVGSWDPWNVTEDADLGIRLARLGWTSGMIESVTFEEAPARFRTWRRQRQRWIKGWMITWLVHMRRPHRLWADLGPAGFLAVQAQVGAVVLSALAHPAGVALIVLHVSGTVPLEIGSSFAGDLVVAGAGLNILFGYGASLWLASRTLAIRGRFALAAHVPLMPLYWLLVSAAAWLALLQLIARPHHWAKTPHVPHDAPRDDPHDGLPPALRPTWTQRLGARLRRLWTG